MRLLATLIQDYVAASRSVGLARTAKPIGIHLRVDAETAGIGAKAFLQYLEGVGVENPTMAELSPRLLTAFTVFCAEHLDQTARTVALTDLTVFVGIFTALFLFFSPANKKLNRKAAPLWIAVFVLTGSIVTYALVSNRNLQSETTTDADAQKSTQTASEDWIETVSKDGRFAISFPGKPTEGRPLTVPSTFGNLELHALRLEIPRTALYEISYATIQQSLDSATVASFFDRIRDAQVKAIKDRNVPVEIGPEKNFLIAGFPARDYSFKPRSAGYYLFPSPCPRRSQKFATRGFRHMCRVLNVEDRKTDRASILVNRPQDVSAFRYSRGTALCARDSVH
jgi:hypothetical protein